MDWNRLKERFGFVSRKEKAAPSKPDTPAAVHHENEASTSEAPTDGGAPANATDIAPTPSPETTSAPEILRVPAANNSWGVDMFDVRPFTLTMISTTKDPECASNAISFGGEDGLCFVGQSAKIARTVDASLHLRTRHPLMEGALFLPKRMEEKWAIFYHRQAIICVRSWTRAVVLIAHTRQHRDTLEIFRIEGCFGDEQETPDFTIRMLDFLLRSHVQDQPWPTPLPPWLADEPLRAAVWCFAAFGNRAICAAVDPPPPAMATKPLCSYSLLHIAAARQDIDAIRRALETIPINARDPNGCSALHWALATNQVVAASALLKLGAEVDARSSEGATPLMEAVQRKSLEQVDFLLERGADCNAGDLRGFTALHRAAEMGLTDIAATLIRHGADPYLDAQGHTPVSLAEATGNNDILAQLHAS